MNLPFSSRLNQFTLKIFGGCVERAAELEPVLEVVAEVIAAERQHRERIAAHDADLADDRRGRLRGHRRRHVDAVRPVVGFGSRAEPSSCGGRRRGTR